MERPPLEQDSPFQSSWPTEPAGPPPEHERLSFFKELPVLIVIAFGLALLIKTFLVQAFFIPSESMVPTLEIGDRVLVNKLAYRFRDPRRGEIIVFVAEKDTTPRSFLQKVRDLFTEGLGVAQPRERDFIKRIIGLPGETVRLRHGTVFIERPGKKKELRLKEPYLSADEETRDFGPYNVPADSFFVMGDNRTNSADSRFGLGPIKRADVVGKAFVRIWPLARVGVMDVPRYSGGKAMPASRGAGLPPLALIAVAGTARRRRAA